MGKKKGAAGVDGGVARCPGAGCKTRLQGDKVARCSQCGVRTCNLHVYPIEHDCASLKKTGASYGTNGNAAGFTVVKAGKAKKDEKMSEEDKKKQDTQDQALLDELKDESAPERLLKEVLSADLSPKALQSNGLLMKALESDSKQVSKALSGSVSRKIVALAKDQGTVADAMTRLLDAMDQYATMAKKLHATEESRGASIVALLAAFVAETGKEMGQILQKSIDQTNCNNEKLSKAISNDLVKAAANAKWDGLTTEELQQEAVPILLALVDQVWNVVEDDDSSRTKLGTCITALVSVCGIPTCGEALLLENLLPALEQPKQTQKLLGSMRIVQLLTKELGVFVMPFLISADFLEKAFDAYDNTAATGRSAIKKALMQVMDKLDPRGVRLAVPILMHGLESPSWRVKQLSLQLLSALGKRKATQLFRELPVLVPTVMECVRDTKKQVSDAARETIDNLGNLVSNPETINLLPWLLDALKDPEHKVEPCLDELMDTTFVNSVDAQSLAFIIPVVLRGLREGSAEVKLKGSVTTGNVCALVADVHDMRPYYSLLMPELKKLTEHSRPRVREMALQAKTSLQEDLSMTKRRSSQSSRDNGQNVAASVAVGSSGAAALAGDAEALSFLSEKLLAFGIRQKLGDIIFEYMSSACKMFLFDMLEDIDEDMPRKMVTRQVSKIAEDGIFPFLEHIMEDHDPLIETLVDAFWIAQGKQLVGDEGHRGEDEKDYIVYIPSIILAFASRVLLKRASIFLERGHRYSIVGMNGTGKSTLCTRLAKRDIHGFPPDVSVYFVEHEINEDDQDLTVLGYMQRDLVAKVTSHGPSFSKKGASKKNKKSAQDMIDLSEERMLAVLDEVGFTEELKQKPVMALSGGWRMRLAIARSMLYDPDLLILDEPTNHLDAGALNWLKHYLAGLKDTTIVLVSHDYEFVDFVATDIVHLADEKLTYYSFGFSDFQKERPEIVAALPKKDDKDAGEKKATAIDLMAAAAQNDDEATALTAGIKPIFFPEGSKLEGIAHRGKPIVTMQNVSYKYPDTDKWVFRDVSVKLTLNSRVAIRGPNGAGKSTLLKIIVGENEVNEKEGHSGKFWKHHNLRTAYIAQHSMHHLEDHIEMTPVQYVQSRFYEGRDKEASKLITTRLTPQDEERMEELGEIAEVMSRVVRSRKVYYEVRKNGRQEKGNNKDFRSLEELEEMSKEKPHVIKLVRLFDEKLKFASSGVDLRPVTTEEIIKHLKDFGIDSEIAQRKVRWMSGGQRARLVLAAAMWIKPHMIILDEPTNYLDAETIAALTFALKNFRGSVLLISHHEAFVDAIANELWHLRDGKVVVESLKNN